MNIICICILFRVSCNYNRWPTRLLTWSLEGVKKEEEDTNKVGKGSGIGDEAEEYNSWRRSKSANMAKSD